MLLGEWQQFGHSWYERSRPTLISFKGYIKEKFVSKEKGSIFTFESGGKTVSKSRFWTGIDGLDRGIIEDSDVQR